MEASAEATCSLPLSIILCTHVEKADAKFEGTQDSS